MDTQGQGFYDKEKGIYYLPKKVWYKAAFDWLRESSGMILLAVIYVSLITMLRHTEGWFFWTLLVVIVVLFQMTMYISLATGFFAITSAWRLVNEAFWAVSKILEITGIEKVLNKMDIEIEKRPQ